MMTKQEFLEKLKPFYTHDSAIKLLIEVIAEILESLESEETNE